MRRLVDAAIERFNNWLGSERGFVQAVVAVFLGWDAHGFLYLYVATEIGLITQFTLAIIGRRSGQKVDSALATIDGVVDQVYVATQTLIQLANNEAGIQKALISQADAIAAALNEIRNPTRKDT